MDIIKVLNLIEDYNIEILLGLIGLVLILLITSLVNAIRFKKARKNYLELTRGEDGVSLEDIIRSLSKELNSVSVSTSLLERDYKKLKKNVNLSIKHMGIIRYNAFDDLGSEQSFSIALLNSEGDGFILTSIYGRDHTSSYLKPIIKGEAQYKLSYEEERALARAGLMEE